MTARHIKTSQQDGSWVSAELQYLFESRTGIRSPQDIRSILINELRIISELKSYGFIRGEDWRINRGFEYPKGGLLEDEGFLLENMRRTDGELASMIGERNRKQEEDNSFVDFENDPDFEYYKPDFLFVHPMGASVREMSIYRMYNIKFIRTMHDAGLKRNVDWSIGDERKDSNGTFHYLYCKNKDQRKLNIFEEYLTSIESQLKTAINTPPEKSTIFIGEKLSEEITREVDVSTVSAIRDYIFSDDSPFRNYDLSRLDDQDFVNIVSVIKSREHISGLAFEGLSSQDKEAWIRLSLDEANILPYAMWMCNHDSSYMRTISNLFSSYRLHEELKELGDEKGVKVPKYSPRRNSDIYDDFLVANKMDVLKVNMFLMEAIYLFVHKEPITEETALMAINALVNYFVMDMLRAYRKSARFRPVEGNDELSLERERDFNGFVSDVMSEDFNRVTESILDKERIVKNNRTIESLNESIDMREIRAKVSEEVQRRIESKI